MTLLEMLSAMFIMAFVGAAMTELCVSHNVVAFRTTGRVDGVIKARRALALIDHDIRAASVFLSTFEPTSSPPGDNAIATWQIPTPSYIASAQTLIVQEPDFAFDGYPKPAPKTVVYKILADKRKPGLGQFVLQRKDFSIIGEPQTILTGIIGPINPSDTVDSIAQTPPPVVFGVISRLTPLYFTKGTFSFGNAALIRGITCNLEVYEESTIQRNATAKSLAFRREVYARGNYAANP